LPNHLAFLNRICRAETSASVRVPEGWRVVCLQRDDPKRAACEVDLGRTGTPIPLSHRHTWVQATEEDPGVYLAILDSSGICRGGCEIRILPTRALPGHYFLRIERYGGSMTDEVADAIAAFSAEVTGNEPRILRADLDIFALDSARRQRFEKIARSCGYGDAAEHRAYGRTAVLDLTPSEDEVFAGLHSSARRNIRATERSVIELRPIVDPAQGPRMDRLLEMTMARTGGERANERWDRRIAFAAEHPESVRIVGAYRTDREPHEALVGFAVGQHQGDHAEYHTAATARPGDLGRLSLGYAPVWDLILWARRSGAQWFDLGGITESTGDRPDPLAGVTEFKHFFTRTDADVRTELTLYPSGLRSALARTVSGAARFVRTHS